MNRRRFFKNTSYAIGGACVLGSFYAWQVEPFWLDIEKHDLILPHLPNDLKGTTIMQISDIHVGNRFDRQFIIDSFDKVKSIEPDIVVYTGDFVSYDNDEQLVQLREVMKSCVKGRVATLGILGNHDYGKNWSQEKVADEIVEILEKENISILRNQKEDVNGLMFYGFEDYWGPNFDTQFLKNQYEIGEPSIALCHNPDVCDLDIWNGFDGCILSGHTHGGQVKPPFLPPPLLPVKNKNYSAGFYDLEGGRQLYINRALGHLHQVRFNVRPEITVFTLA